MGGPKSGRWVNRRAWSAEEDAALADMTSQRLRDTVIGERLGRSEHSVQQRRFSLGMKKGSGQLKAVPADFAEVAPGKSVLWLMERYDCGYKSIRSWRKECGIVIEPRVAKPKAAKAPRAAGDADDKRSRPVSWPRKPIFHVDIDSSIPSLAAQHLRSFYPCVHRADIRLEESTKRTWGDARGLPDSGRDQYFVSGIGVVPAYEMVAIARDRGFAA